MSGWPQHSNGGAYPGALDSTSPANLMDMSSMNSMYSNNGGGFDFAQFNNGAAGGQQRMPNGGGAMNPQNAFQNPPFNVGSVVPSKRPRQNEEGMGGMARGPPGNSSMMNTSRAQTPMQQPNTAFQTGGQQPGPPGQQFHPHNPYQHLQHAGSADATPSPTMQSQPFRPPQPQRGPSASPATFGMQPSMNPQMSPVNHGQNNAPSMSPQPNFSPSMNGGAFGQAFTPQGMMNNGGMQNPMQGQGMNMPSNQQMQIQQMQQRQQYQQRLLQQQQRMQAAGMSGQRPPQPNQSPMPQNQAPPQGQVPGQQPGQNMQVGQQQMIAAQKQEQWLRSLGNHLQQKGIAFNPRPNVAGRPLNLYMLWSCIIAAGGSEKVNEYSMWGQVAQKLGYGGNNAQAIQELRQVHQMYLSSFEDMYKHARAQQRQQQAQMQARHMAGLGPQGTPSRQSQPDQNGTPMPVQQQQHQQSQPPPTPVASNHQMPPSFTQPGADGSLIAPTMQQQATPMDNRRSSGVKRSDTNPPDQSPALGFDGKLSVGPDGRPPSVKREVSTGSVKPAVVQSTEYEPYKRTVDSYGGYDVMSLGKLGGELVRLVPDVPGISEMGLIDIRALTLSLASGMHAEVRHAIDSLAFISLDSRINLELEKCDDLADVLIDCAQDQLDILAEDAVEVSDAIDLPSYEEVLRSSRAESVSLRDIPAVGSKASTLERAAEKLIGITTILRNVSFDEGNHRLLSAPSVISMISTAIRLMGTRNMPLRNFTNVIDFYKDVVTFLSNITDKLELPSREDALHLLHFLLAFAPQPAPTLTAAQPLTFYSYSAPQHRYLPLAVDSIAKLLARQEPNRGFYRTIFTSSVSQNAESDELTPSDLLTRAFALCICVLPDRSKGTLSTSVELRTVEARKALLTQGMLAADMLASLVPSASSSSSGSDDTSGASSIVPDLARAWLESDDRWTASLLRMAYVLSQDRGPPSAPAQQAGGRAGQPATRIGPDGRMQIVQPDEQGYGLVTHRGLGMLKRLVQKAGRSPTTTSTTMQRQHALNGASIEIDGRENGKSDAEGTAVGAADGAGGGDGGAGRQTDEDEEDYDAAETESRSRLWLKGDPAPHRETVLGALLMPNADKEALRLLCQLYDMVGA